MSTSSNHVEADQRHKSLVQWAARAELFLRHLAMLFGITFPRPPKGQPPFALLDALETWMTRRLREDAEPRDTLPEVDADALRKELDEQTERAAFFGDKVRDATDMLATGLFVEPTDGSLLALSGRALDELRTSRVMLAKLHGVEPDAFTLSTLVTKTVDLIALGDRARQIKAERERDENKAELNKVTRELATEREERRADETKRARCSQLPIDRMAELQDRATIHKYCNDAGAPPDATSSVPRVRWMVEHIRECERIINGCRAAFGKKPMGAGGEEYMDLVADVQAAVAAQTAMGECKAKIAAMYVLGDDLRARGGLIPLPKPEKIEAGQRWARVMTVHSLDYERDPIDENGGVWGASRMKADDSWIYLGPAKEG